MTTKVLWFVLAGFLLGFTVSTLWEWFHFRRERLKLTDRRIRELEDQLREREEAALLPAPEVTAAPWSEPPYRSPGVFLETESLPPEPETLAPRVTPLPPDRVPVSEPVVPRSVPARPPAVAEDPGRARRAEALAALRRTSEAKQRGSEAKPDAKPDAKVEAKVDVKAASPPAATRAVTELSFIPAAEPPAVEPSHWSQDPTLTRRAADHPDDLSRIRGIGDVYKQRLYRAGIFTWHQIAEADADSLRRATSAYPSSNVEEWPEQARKLADKAGRGGAIYAGPLPDDFTKIHGIGPVGLQSLYRAGICTFEQLAVTPVDELAALFPIAVAGDQPDFAQWVAQATRLADAKHQS